ncbi:hypothetical protein BC830DRAFT_312292 [Chytriomyces sp. MP71]|nr:hypothetical protein BC830DRAFT_312292 [Chytriomyces sp. MP71]
MGRRSTTSHRPSPPTSSPGITYDNPLFMTQVTIGALVLMASAGYLVLPSVARMLGSLGTSATSEKDARRMSTTLRKHLEVKRGEERVAIRAGEAFFPPGLNNLGNTCFLNSTVQALVALPSMVIYLRERVTAYYADVTTEQDDSVSDLVEKKPLHVTEAMLDLAVSLNAFHKKRAVIRPGFLLTALETVKKSNHRLLCYEQQDAHELLQLVSGNLTDEELPLPASTRSLFDLATLASPASAPSAHSHILTGPRGTLLEDSLVPATPLKNPLTGLMANIMTCTRCGYRSAMNCAIFSNISLAVPAVAQVTIEQLLQSYISPEPIHDYKCDKCTLIATARTLQDALEEVQEEAEAVRLKASATKEVIKSPSPLGKKSKKGRKKGDNSPAATPVPTPSVMEDKAESSNEATLVNEADAAKMEQLLSRLAQLERDHNLVLNASKFNVEAKLPPQITLTRTVSPLTTKQIVLAAPPQALCLHMQRSIFLPSGHSYKSTCRVVFGEVLSLAPFCLNSNETPLNLATGGDTAGVGWADLIRAAREGAAAPGSVLQESPVLRPRQRQGGGVVGGAAGGYVDLPPTSGYSGLLAGAAGAKAYCGATEATEYLYRLRAVVIHYGGHDSGHFVTYRRCPHPASLEFQEFGMGGGPVVEEAEGKGKGGRRRKAAAAGVGDARWFRISDERVDPVVDVSGEVFGHACQHAYMLFYERERSK